MMRTEETVPTPKEVSSVLDSFKKQVASSRCVSVKVYLVMILTLFYKYMLCEDGRMFHPYLEYFLNTEKDGGKQTEIS